jgi:hypothetical protein
MLFFKKKKEQKTPWFYIEENKDIFITDNVIKITNGNKYQFQLAGNCKLKERTYNHYYYEFKFTSSMAQEFNNAIKIIENYLKCKLTIFCYDEHRCNLLIVSKQPISKSFSAICSFAGVTKVGRLYKAHIKFEEIKAYQSWPSVVSMFVVDKKGLVPIQEEEE